MRSTPRAPTSNLIFLLLTLWLWFIKYICPVIFIYISIYIPFCKTFSHCIFYFYVLTFFTLNQCLSSVSTDLSGGVGLYQISYRVWLLILTSIWIFFKWWLIGSILYQLYNCKDSGVFSFLKDMTILTGGESVTQKSYTVRTWVSQLFNYTESIDFFYSIVHLLTTVICSQVQGFEKTASKFSLSMCWESWERQHV